MNASEGNFRLELVRPPDVDFSQLSWAEQQVNQSNYFNWLRAASEFDPSLVDKEEKKYATGKWAGTSPEEFGGRGYYLGVCEHCGK